ncbi:UDP-4-amino-4,6-dideoxy-N-acetyl-beta-L-altrosamine transaminase [Catenovulum sp. SM1970]|uniref:UDP-4-amino-4, 6-dideoxy-N-acetyl-beta-L-altrosamine transaminase n=1 Tax=Marinifaba aquimaris TaxID=2741323 RepID=UPI001574EC6F|nr:UDP-4-amino-4,6-dideoxy-N-acetyl-beta-L-altrosamine transaminase [Marinifaba aquimaris]NTS75383.1 UDP-4-amino-4,6-dideoxy-N-acetyl-beta-L-altrosamine transaminase [Marinifaba aquimaris]
MSEQSHIPYGMHHIEQDDIDAAIDVLENHFLTQGQKVPEFEARLAEFAGAQYAVAVNSGTSALHIACLALGVGKGDKVWTSPNTFVASANCALYCQAEVDFVDIDSDTLNISVESLAEKLRWAEKHNCLPKVVIVVHFAGLSCDMQAIDKLAKKYYFSVIEDASHAFGGQYQQQMIGCCNYSSATICSFHPVKPITTAEGGAVLTNDAKLAKRLNLFAKHGVTRDETQMSCATERLEHGDWYYQQVELGYNYRLSDLQAALGISQLKKLSHYIELRLEKAKKYHALLANHLDEYSIKLPLLSEQSAWHIYTIQIPAKQRKVVFDALRANNIGVNVHYIPVHLQPFYQQMGFKKGDFPIAEQYYQSALTLPLFPALTYQQQQKVIECLLAALKQTKP